MVEDQESAVEQASTLRSGERSYKERERERDVVWCGVAIVFLVKVFVAYNYFLVVDEVIFVENGVWIRAE